jgi:hypothetical protein
MHIINDKLDQHREQQTRSSGIEMISLILENGLESRSTKLFFNMDSLSVYC